MDLQGTELLKCEGLVRDFFFLCRVSSEINDDQKQQRESLEYILPQMCRSSRKQLLQHPKPGTVPPASHADICKDVMDEQVAPCSLPPPETHQQDNQERGSSLNPFSQELY